MAEVPPVYTMSFPAKVGKVVQLGEYLVPEQVMATITNCPAPEGKENIEGRKWPDMTFTFEVRDGVAMCVDFRISSKKGDRPIRTQDLRFINVDELAIQAFDAHAMTRVSPGHAHVTGKSDPAATREIRHKVDANRDVSHSEYKQVARIYCDPANRLTPSLNVEIIMNYGSRATADRRIREARRLEFIPPLGSSAEDYDRKFEELTRELEN